jgi:hypothetical protein
MPPKQLPLGTILGVHVLTAHVDAFYCDATCVTCGNSGCYLTHRLKDTSCSNCYRAATVTRIIAPVIVPGTVTNRDLEKLKRTEKAFWKTVSAYVTKAHLPVIGCSSSDPESTSGTLRKHYSNFLADVEIATKRALDHDREMYGHWCSIVRRHANYPLAPGEQPVPAAIEQHIIQACGRIYLRRLLDDVRTYMSKSKLTARGRQAIYADFYKSDKPEGAL